MVQANEAVAGADSATGASESSLVGLVGALADGGLDALEAERVIDALLDKPELRAAWERVHVVGDCLRSEETGAQPASDAFMARFSERLAQELALLAPNALAPASDRWRRFGLPALSVAAAVAMVSWIAWPNRPVAVQGPPVAALASSSVPAAVVPSTLSGGVVPAAHTTVAANTAAASQPVDAGQLREYVAAHQQYSSPQLNGMGTFHAAAWSTSSTDSTNP